MQVHTQSGVQIHKYMRITGEAFFFLLLALIAGLAGSTILVTHNVYFFWLHQIVYNIPSSQLRSYLLIHLIMLHNSSNCSLFQAQGLRRCVEEIVFSYTYPRLDMEVKENSSVVCVCTGNNVLMFKVALAPNQLYTHARYQST